MQQILTPRSELAHALSLSETRVAALLHAGILPKKTRGGYDLIPSVRAYIHYLRTNSHSTLAVERTRLTKAKADRAELDLKVRAGELWKSRK